TFERDVVSTVKEQIEIKNDIVVEKVIPPSIDRTKTEPIPKVCKPQFFERTFEKKEEPIKVYNPVIEEVKKVEEKTEEKPVIKEEKNVDFKLIGQVFDTYIIIEQDDKMMIIDQHAAHERLKYEELIKEIENTKAYSQPMVVPVIANLTAKELSTFKENTDFISSLGFEAEEFDDNSVIIRAVPASQTEDIENLFIEIISQLDENKREVISDKRQRLLYTIACKAAIKANHRLSENEQKELVKNVLSLENINTCPHGRPIIVSMSQKEIEKEFKRVL
ncbi:MAG: hypothetical protein IKK18_05140, partial [Clostridia bacterium]|nr:hypothetical protein [Clostridia bacterium]